MLASLLETTKPGITRLVTITSMVGFGLSWLESPGQRATADLIATGLGCAVGTALSASGANALNQVMERFRDREMDRTKKRPLPQDRVEPRTVLWFGLASALAGLALLLALCGPVPSLISLWCVVSYTLIYTPSKPITSFSTYLGTLPGALPPLIGWSAGWQPGGAESLAHPGGWTLFALMTVWQLPHFFAIAWMYRDDYAKGGYRVLPVVDPSGNLTATTIAVWTVLQLPVSVTPALAMPGLLGWPYIVIAVLSGLGFTWLAFRLIRTRSNADARKVFFASIAYLPLVMTALVVEAAIRAMLRD